MKKLDRLFVLACKAKHPQAEVFKVYREHYSMVGELTEPKITPQIAPHITGILAKICDTYSLWRSTVELLDKLNPKDYMNQDIEDYYTTCAIVLMIKIRLSEISKFTDLNLNDDLLSQPPMQQQKRKPE